MQKASLILLNILLIGQISFAQQSDEQPSWSMKQEIAPLALITIGSILLLSNIDSLVQKNIYKTTTDLDDYTQWAPIGIMYALDAFKVPAKNSVQTQTAYFGIATISNAILVHGLKNITHRTRPSNAKHSFPSGHTSQAFVSATVFWHEFKDTNPILASSAYVFATATGIMRMVNNKHWFTDVVVGAGVGILVTDLLYAWDPLKNWDGFKFENSSLKPSIGQMGEATVASLKFQF
ncbi:MAG: membrane-associated phospholipid phosphatase [Flavobacteriales bacterium]|jgi:membrane-associated phospholipid phosphatase